MKFSTYTTLLSAFFFLSSAQAHNVWLEQNPANAESYIIKFGHESEPYPLSKLTSVTTYSADLGKFSDIKSSSQFIPAPNTPTKGEMVITPKNATLVFIAFDNGVWSKLPSGKYVEKTKAEAPEAEFSMNPQKIGKAILQWNDEALKPHQQNYELVPQSKPEIGKPLEILVLKSGKPVQGIKVGLGEDLPFNLTNENGIAQFTPTAGVNKVWAEFEEKVADNPLYTERSYEYMLTFELSAGK